MQFKLLASRVTAFRHLDKSFYRIAVKRLGRIICMVLSQVDTENLYRMVSGLS